jgi:hypothetical protein
MDQVSIAAAQPTPLATPWRPVPKNGSACLGEAEAGVCPCAGEIV